jgi:hypothetical protein
MTSGEYGKGGSGPFLTMSARLACHSPGHSRRPLLRPLLDYEIHGFFYLDSRCTDTSFRKNNRVGVPYSGNMNDNTI